MLFRVVAIKHLFYVSGNYFDQEGIILNSLVQALFSEIKIDSMTFPIIECIRVISIFLISDRNKVVAQFLMGMV
jgi:hypothetical protein